MNGKQGSDSRFITYIKLFVLCFVSALCNLILNYLANGIFALPLYLDTVFTAAVCCTAGLIPGIITGIILPAILHPLNYIYIYHYPVQTIWPVYFFYICALAEIILICIFHKKIKPVEDVFLNNLAAKKPFFQSFIPMATQLLVLAALACVIISILGGIIGYLIYLFAMPRSSFPEDTFLLGLLKNNVPQLASEIFSRIPINVVDRFFVVFAGYGISLLYRKWLKV